MKNLVYRISDIHCYDPQYNNLLRRLASDSLLRRLQSKLKFPIDDVIYNEIFNMTDFPIDIEFFGSNP